MNDEIFFTIIYNESFRSFSNSMKKVIDELDTKNPKYNLNNKYSIEGYIGA